MEDYTYDYEYQDPDPTEPFLTMDEKKKCCDIMRSTGNIPHPATDNEISAILNWLNGSKTNYPMFVCYEYKDCCFQIMEDHKWALSHKNNDLMFRELLYGRSNLW